jgi:hypothetical protein
MKAFNLNCALGLIIFGILGLQASACSTQTAKIVDSLPKLCIDPKFGKLTKDDSTFVFNVINREKPIKHHIIKVDSGVILTIVKKNLEQVYVTRNGAIDDYYEIENGKVVLYCKEFE